MANKVKELDHINKNIFIGTIGVFLSAKNKDKYEKEHGLFLLWEYLKSVDKQKPYLRVLQNRQSIVGALHFLSTAKYAPLNHLTKEKCEELQKIAEEYLEYDTDMFFEKIQNNFHERYEIDDNMVKLTTNELGITQRELAEIIKVNAGTPAQWVSKGEVPPTYQYLLELMLENKHLKEKITKFTAFKELLNEI